MIRVSHPKRSIDYHLMVYVSDSEEKKTDDSFGAKLAAQIVKNLQIFITNVHICYEDHISWPQNPFQVGLTLHKLVFQTQNDEQKKNANENIIYKLVTLEGLSFYWNCKQVFNFWSSVKTN